ncbi:MAG: glutaminase A [Gammaproteobacteria bacterium]|nr:glutaminase A [Gammaproteobacteria bacterium]
MVSYAPFLHKYLQTLHQKFSELNEGNLADYIPELTKANPDWFGITLVTVDGHVYQEGASREKFTIQSISKPFVFGIALEDCEAHVINKKVNTEPSGEAFNRISLEHNSGRPRNPLINAGAIAMSGSVRGNNAAERIEQILKKFALFTGHPLEIDDAVFQSEKSTGHRNRAIAHLLLNAGIIDSAPDEVLDVYFKQCSINVDCRDLAVMASTLANQGVNPVTGVRAMKAEVVPKVLSVMATCGMYDGSGEWMYNIGLPAKSGVGGGILAVYPGKFGMAVFSPLLDKHGNSVRGIKVFQQMSQDLHLHTLNSERFTTSSVIRATFTGAQIRSRRVRGKEERSLLDEQGERIHIVELNGEMMFAAAEIAVSEVDSRLEVADYVILDLRRVSSMDAAAAQLIVWLVETMHENGKYLYLTGTIDKYAVTKYIKSRLSKVDALQVLSFKEMDSALEWCEDQLLQEAGISNADMLEVEFNNHPMCDNLDEEEKQYLKDLVKFRRYNNGEYICREGDTGELLFFILKGSVNVNLPLDNGKQQCVARFSAGGSFGEQAIVENSRRSADILAECDVICTELNTNELFQQTSELAYRVRFKLLSKIAIELSSKLRMANREIRYLTA